MNEPMPGEPAVMARRVPDACRAIGIGKSTLYKLAAEGKVRLIRIAGRTVVPESEIIRLASYGVPHLVPHLAPHKNMD